MTDASSSDPRLAAAVEAFCEVHAEDPEGDALAYHRALAAQVEALDPAAPVALRLAAWCQHLRRWAIPRSDFPEGRRGYKHWRTTLAARHAEDAAEILSGVGWDPGTVERVGELLRKQGLGRDPDVGTLEDAVCLVFLSLQLEAFAARHPPQKVESILRKTWAKMTPRGRAAAGPVVQTLAADVAALVVAATRDRPPP